MDWIFSVKPPLPLVGLVLFIFLDEFQIKDDNDELTVGGTTTTSA
jgi:hypothetical protein